MPRINEAADHYSYGPASFDAAQPNRLVVWFLDKILHCVFFAALLLVLSAALVCDPTLEKACALDPLGSSQVSVATAFHDSYKAKGKTYTHCGVDLPAKGGSAVTAPCDGEISFVGNVPAGDSALGDADADETMLAVSITMKDGRIVTLMPFKSTSASPGDVVEKGDKLGKLASSGDRSLKTSHLHMGLKRNGVYYDPSSLLGIKPSKSASDAAETATSPLAAPSTKALEAEAEATATTSGAVSASRLSATQESLSYGTISSGSVAWVPSSKAAQPDVFAFVGSAACEFSERCAAQGQGLAEGLQQLASATGIPLLFLVIAIAVLVTSLLAAMLLALRHLVRMVGPQVKNRTALLCRREVGDSMHKLFPAPGTTFITRGRIAQRR